MTLPTQQAVEGAINWLRVLCDPRACKCTLCEPKYKKSAELAIEALQSLPELRQKAEADRNEIFELRLKLRDADEVAAVIDEMVQGQHLNPRSKLADTRLNYGEPWKYEYMPGKLAESLSAAHNLTPPTK